MFRKVLAALGGLVVALTGLVLLNTLGDLLSKSRIERAVMTPATGIVLVCLILVARS